MERWKGSTKISERDRWRDGKKGKVRTKNKYELVTFYECHKVQDGMNY